MFGAQRYTKLEQYCPKSGPFNKIGILLFPIGTGRYVHTGGIEPVVALKDLRCVTSFNIGVSVIFRSADACPPKHENI